MNLSWLKWILVSSLEGDSLSLVSAPIFSSFQTKHPKHELNAAGMAGKVRGRPRPQSCHVPTPHPPSPFPPPSITSHMSHSSSCPRSPSECAPLSYLSEQWFNVWLEQCVVLLDLNGPGEVL